MLERLFEMSADCLFEDGCGHFCGDLRRVDHVGGEVVQVVEVFEFAGVGV
jgi:hypothetical protein